MDVAFPPIYEPYAQNTPALDENTKLIEKLQQQASNLRDFQERFLIYKPLITNIVRKPCIEGDLRHLYNLVNLLRNKIAHEKSRLENSNQELNFEMLDFEWENTITIVNHIDKNLAKAIEDYDGFIECAKTFCGTSFLLSGLLNIQRIQKIIECIRNATKHLLRLKKKCAIIRFRIMADIILFVKRKVRQIRPQSLNNIDKSCFKTEMGTSIDLRSESSLPDGEVKIF